MTLAESDEIVKNFNSPTAIQGIGKIKNSNDSKQLGVELEISGNNLDRDLNNNEELLINSQSIKKLAKENKSSIENNEEYFSGELPLVTKKNSELNSTS